MSAEQGPREGTSDEQDVVDGHAGKYYQETMQGVDRDVNTFAVQRLVPRLRGPAVLELGCGDGLWTEALVQRGLQVTVVDGAQQLVDRLAARLGQQVQAHCALFEELELEQRFDEVICAHVLEHVGEPAAVIEVVRRHLRPGGAGLFVVPNAESLHRRIGVAMGLLERVTDLSDSDRYIGHRRVYTIDELLAQLRGQGLEIVDWGGVFLKPLANAQMEGWSPELLGAFDTVGVELPRWAVQIWALARKA